MAESIIEKNGSKCFLCGRTGPLETHHIIHGTSGRKKADEYGLTVRLCRACHSYLHDTEEGRDDDRMLQDIGQRMFEKIHGHEKWMAVFGKSYLLEGGLIPQKRDGV